MGGSRLKETADFGMREGYYTVASNRCTKRDRSAGAAATAAGAASNSGLRKNVSPHTNVSTVTMARKVQRVRASGGHLARENCTLPIF